MSDLTEPTQDPTSVDTDARTARTLSIVIPCYNEEDTIEEFITAVNRVAEVEALRELEMKIIFVNDGSTDDSLALIKRLAETHGNIGYISLSRNFGKEAAIFAGLQHADGDYCALMDADLQDPPELLAEMFEAIRSGAHDCVAARRISRKGEPLIRSFFARMFYRIINTISNVEIVDGARDFRLMTRQMVEAILSMKECNRFSKGLFSWVGFAVHWIPYKNIERVSGTTKWSLWKLFLYSIEGILAFSTMPLAIASLFGIVISFLALVGIIAIVVRTLIYSDPVSGWPSLACIISFIGGLNLLCLGIIGQYLAKTYLETKQRPLYIIREINLR